MFRNALACAIATALILLPTAGQAAAQLDSSFSDDGVLTMDLGSAVESATDVIAQPDGKLISVGFTDGDVVILRFNPDGSLDPGFGGDGMIREDLGGDDAAGAVALQPTGEIVVAAISRNLYATANRVVLLRYEPDGTPDLTFGIQGRASVPSTSTLPKDVFIQSDGKVAVSLCCYGKNWRSQSLTEAPVTAVRILRFDASGRPLAGFAIPNATGIDMQADDRFVAAVTYGRNSDWTVPWLTCVPLTDICTPLPTVSGSVAMQALRVAVIRLLPDGAPDTSFGRGGIAPITDSVPIVSTSSTTHVRVQGDKAASSLVLAQPDGGIILAYTRDAVWTSDDWWTQPSDYYELIRLHPDGSRDETYAARSGVGTKVIDLQAHVGGAITALYEEGSYKGIKRFLPEGTVDTNLAWTTPDGFTFGSIADQPDGNVVVAGRSGSLDWWNASADISLARYLLAADTYTLTAESFRDKGINYVYLRWTGPAGEVDLYRDGEVIATTSDSFFSDTSTKGPGAFVYKVCKTTTTTCSQEVTVSF